MKYAVICFVAFAGLMGLSAVQAQTATTPYTYVEGMFQATTFDTSGMTIGATVLDKDLDGNGPRFEASVALHENVYIFGNYATTSVDDFTDTTAVPPVTLSFADVDTWGIGLGINTSLSTSHLDRNYRGLSDRFTVFFDAQYLDGGPVDTDGYALDLGFRAINFTRLEFIASIGVEKFDRLDSELTLEGRLLYRLINNFQIQGGMDWNDQATKYFIGLRWGFPYFAVFKARN